MRFIIDDKVIDRLLVPVPVQVTVIRTYYRVIMRNSKFENLRFACDSCSFNVNPNLMKMQTQISDIPVCETVFFSSHFHKNKHKSTKIDR